MKQSLRFALGLIMFSAYPLGIATAQTATFSGAVVRDTLSHGLPEATVAIPALQRTTSSDARGEFRMTGLPSGRFAAIIRRIGFTALVDTIDLVNGASVDREYVLDPTPTVLDSIRINAVAEPKHLTAGLAQFEEHRKLGFGHFVTEAELRKNDSRKLNDVLTARIPSLSTYRPYPRTMPSVEWLTSGRGACEGPAMRCQPGVVPCPVNLYLNGSAYFVNGAAQDTPDISHFATNELEAVEYYAGGATIPQQYNSTSNGCGVLILWTRER